jgi:H/ACA ribonucleoprotein complex subunit 1
VIAVADVEGALHLVVGTRFKKMVLQQISEAYALLKVEAITETSSQDHLLRSLVRANSTLLSVRWALLELSLLEMGAFVHASAGDMVYESTNPKIPYFNADIFLENKTKIGKVDEILGPINKVYFSVKPQEGIVATSFKSGDKVFISSDKLLPLERFLPKPKPPPGLPKPKKAKGPPGGVGGGRGSGGGPRGRGTTRGRGFGDRGGRGGRGGFGRGGGFSRGGPPRGGGRGGFRGRGS